MRELELLESRQAKPVLTISKEQPGYLDLPSETLDRLICTEPIEKYYEVEDQPFARGKFAAVRKCTHRATGQAFAAKFLRKRRRSAELRAEIVHEVAVLEACSACPRVVRLHHVFESDAEMILLLELAPGGELQMLLDQDEVPEERHVARLMRQILDGVCYLHSINVAHLDIKPQNLVLTGEYPDCDVKLCDFGISRYISHGADIREILGTPDYVAPEVLNYEPISLATDMWSVGVLVYVLLTGCSPFGGDTKQETFCNISQCKLDFPEDLFEEISEEAKDLISRLLVKDPSKRLSATECLAHAWFCSQGVLQPVSVPVSVPAKVATSVTKVTTCVSEAVRSPTPITETCQPPAPIKSSVPSLAAIKTQVSSPTIKRKQASPILSRTRAVSPVPGSKPSGPVVPPIKATNPTTVPQIKVQAVTNAAIVSRTVGKNVAPLSLPPPLPSTPPPLPSTPPPSLTSVKKSGIKADRKSVFKKNMESLVQMIDTAPLALPTAASVTTATTTSTVTTTRVDNDNANNNNNTITNSVTSLPAALPVSRTIKSTNKVTATHTMPAGFRHQFGPSNLFTAMMQGNPVPRRSEERESVYKFRRCYVDSEEDNASALHPPHRMFLHSSGPSSTGSDSPYEHSSDTSSDTVSEMSIDSSSDRSSIISLDDSLDLAFSKRLYGDHSNWDIGSFNVRLYRQQLLQQARNSNSSNIRRVWPKECNGSFARAFSLFSEDPKSKDSNRMQASRRWKAASARSVTTNCTLNGATAKGLRKCSVELMREENGNLVVIREVENGKYSRFSEVKCESLQSRIRKLQVQGAQS